MYLFFRMEGILLGRSRTGVGVGVGVDIFRPESESESLNIHRLCSPGQRYGTQTDAHPLHLSLSSDI